jgi:hypothetical protein
METDSRHPGSWPMVVNPLACERERNPLPLLRCGFSDGKMDLAVMAVVVMAMAIVVVIIVARVIVIIIIATTTMSTSHLLQILLIEFDLSGLLVAGALCTKSAENIFHHGSSFFFYRFLYFSIFFEAICVFVFS